jgi:5-oxopent-3-ene-1,2,5-tricarboxylate decarboxylase/2-hydroxyhepta-2,4-diene-1,7-dioate isomerase
MHGELRRGTVYGTLLNHRDALAALGEAVQAAPYKAPPRAPVLYIKPRNTWVGNGEAIVVPEGVESLEIGATLGLVIGRSARRLTERDAMGWVAGYVILNDVSVPHASYYRPSLRFKARDTFCPIGGFTAMGEVGDPRALAVSVSIDGEVVQRSGFGALVREPAKLLADVTEFMTLSPGDVLSIGVAAGAPRARAGQRVRIAIDRLGVLENPLVAREAAA